MNTLDSAPDRSSNGFFIRHANNVRAEPVILEVGRLISQPRLGVLA